MFKELWAKNLCLEEILYLWLLQDVTILAKFKYLWFIADSVPWVFLTWQPISTQFLLLINKDAAAEQSLGGICVGQIK